MLHEIISYFSIEPHRIEVLVFIFVLSIVFFYTFFVRVSEVYKNIKHIRNIFCLTLLTSCSFLSQFLLFTTFEGREVTQKQLQTPPESTKVIYDHDAKLKSIEQLHKSNGSLDKSIQKSISHTTNENGIEDQNKLLKLPSSICYNILKSVGFLSLLGLLFLISLSIVSGNWKWVFLVVLIFPTTHFVISTIYGFSIIVAVDNYFLGQGIENFFVNPSQVLMFICFSVGVGLPVRFLFMLYEVRTELAIEMGKKDKAIEIKSYQKAFLVVTIIISIVVSMMLIGANIQAVAIMTAIIVAGATLALQELLGNFISGLLLLWDNTIKKNDVLSIQHDATTDDEVPYGWVDKITMRHTIIRDRNDIHLVVPNSLILNNQVVNWSQEDKTVRIKLDVDVAYGTDIRQAKTLMKRAALSQDRVLKYTGKTPSVNTMAFKDSGIHLQLRFFINDPKSGIRNIKSFIFDEILLLFKEGNIEIPFPQYDIHFKSDENGLLQLATNLDRSSR